MTTKPAEMTDYSKLTNAEIDRRVARALFTDEGDLTTDAFVYCGPDLVAFRPFSESYEAAHAAWAKLTSKQKMTCLDHSLREMAHGEFMLDATPRDLCIWMLQAVETEASK